MGLGVDVDVDVDVDVVRLRCVFWLNLHGRILPMQKCPECSE